MDRYLGKAELATVLALAAAAPVYADSGRTHLNKIIVQVFDQPDARA